MFQKLKNIYHLSQALLANLCYGFPSRKLKVIGVTGTDGKTTTTALIYHILKSAGKKVSVISTVYAQIGDEIYDTGFHVTTPSPFAVQKFLKMAVANGDEFFVLEVTSHSLDQYRVWGVEFEVGLITNVTHEHLDYHKTYEEYVRAKARLLQMSKIKIMNRDDKSYEFLKEYLRSHNYFTFGLKNPADFQIDIAKKINQSLADFNQYNYLSAYAVCQKLGLADEEIFSAMKTFQLPPGRMEVVYDKDFTVIVDFAHTPFGIEQALKAIKETQNSKLKTQNSRLIHVFSSASERDESKRPFMGEASGTYADLVILTEEDYRNEDPYKINREIAAGLIQKGFQQVPPAEFGKKNSTYTVLVNRGEAVKKAIEIVHPGDVIIITGKGHEKSLCRGNKEYPWNDREAVLKELHKMDL